MFLVMFLGTAVFRKIMNNQSGKKPQEDKITALRSRKILLKPHTVRLSTDILQVALSLPLPKEATKATKV